MKATWAKLILCWIAVNVGFSHETWDPKYLHSAALGTVEPSANSRGVAGVFGCVKCSVFVRFNVNPRNLFRVLGFRVSGFGFKV